MMTIDELLIDLRSIDQRITQLGDERNALRSQVQLHVAALGGRFDTGYAKAAIMPATTHSSYDARALDSIVAAMVATGDMDLIEWARQIATARRVTTRSGSLRVTWVGDEQR